MNGVGFLYLLLCIASGLWPAVGGAISGDSTEVAARRRDEDIETIRDPFGPLQTEAAAHVDASPIERFALRELRLVATINGVGLARALIEDPDGLGFITTVGTHVGTEGYAVVAVARGEIVLEGPPSSPNAGVRVIMKLGDGQGES